MRLKVVQERLSHADITLTLNTYSHVLPAMQEGAATKLDERLTPIDVNNDLKKVKEQKVSYEVWNVDSQVTRHISNNGSSSVSSIGKCNLNLTPNRITSLAILSQ